jgi:integrase
MTSKSPIISGTIESVPKVPTHVVIFKVACSPYFWTRCYVNGRYTVRSTKTENKREAYAFAKEVFNNALLNLKANPKSKIKSRLFAVLATALVNHEKTTAKKSLYLNDKGKVEGFLIPQFGTKNIDEIEYGDLVGMMEELNKKKLAPATKKHYLSLTSKIFKYAVQEGVLKSIPQFPKLQERLTTKEKRDYLTNGEYTRLNNTVIKLEAAGVKVRGIAVTEELKWLNKFMINAFLRPTDIKVLKHKHLERRVETDESGRKIEWLVLNHPATKTTAHPVQAMPKIVPAYERLLQFRKIDHARKLKEAKALTGKDKYGVDKKQKALAALEGSPYLNPDDYVFFPEYKNRQTMIGTWSRLFRYVVQASKLEDTTGKNIQLYSLRHTAIMFRLIRSNVDSLILAKNARTSQGVIEQFYGAHLTTDLSRRQLHSYLPVRKKQKVESPSEEVPEPEDDDYNQDEVAIKSSSNKSKVAKSPLR